MKELTMKEAQQVSGSGFTTAGLWILSGLSAYVTIRKNEAVIVSTLNSIGERAKKQRGAKAWQD